MTVPNSFSGKAQATTLYADVSNVATSFTVTATGTWTETVGSHIGQPLGTSGPFVITLDYGQSTEEKVLCTGITGSGPYTITVATGGRGYDSGPGNPSAQGHSASSAYPVVHTYSADIPQQANLGVTNAAAAQATANSATTTANAALPKAGGTMTGAINMNSQALSNLATSTTAQDAATYAQVSTAQTTANNVQLPSSALKINGTVPSTATPLKVVGWTVTVTTANQSTTGAGVSIPYAFPNALMSVVGTFSNESSAAGAGSRCTIDTNSANNSFRVWVYNAAGSKVANGGTYQFSFIAVGY
jgi:hypothetical protein